MCARALVSKCLLYLSHASLEAESKKHIHVGHVPIRPCPYSGRSRLERSYIFNTTDFNPSVNAKELVSLGRNLQLHMSSRFWVNFEGIWGKMGNECLWLLKYPIYHQTVRRANGIKIIVHYFFCVDWIFLSAISNIKVKNRFFLSIDINVESISISEAKWGST